MAESIFPCKLTTIAPWAWHGLAVPSGTSTLHDIVSDTAIAFATANALGMAMRTPCLPSLPNYQKHIARIPFKTSLFIGEENNRLNNPLAKRLNLDYECGLPKHVHIARSSGNIKDYYYIQEVAVGSEFYGCFLHSNPFSIASEVYATKIDKLVVRLGLGRNGVGLLERCSSPQKIIINLHTARMYNPEINIKAGAYRLHTIQPSIELSSEDALNITASWS